MNVIISVLLVEIITHILMSYFQICVQTFVIKSVILLLLPNRLQTEGFLFPLFLVICIPRSIDRVSFWKHFDRAICCKVPERERERGQPWRTQSLICTDCVISLLRISFISIRSYILTGAESDGSGMFLLCNILNSVSQMETQLYRTNIIFLERELSFGKEITAVIFINIWYQRTFISSPNAH
jgi:hypothetical protein